MIKLCLSLHFLPCTLCKTDTHDSKYVDLCHVHGDNWDSLELPFINITFQTDSKKGERRTKEALKKLCKRGFGIECSFKKRLTALDLATLQTPSLTYFVIHHLAVIYSQPNIHTYG